MSTQTSAVPVAEPNITPMIDVLYVVLPDVMTAMDIARSAGVRVIGIAPKAVVLHR